MNKISINHKILGLTVIQKTQNYNKLVPGFNSCVGGEINRQSPRCTQLSKYTIANSMPELCKKANINPFGLHAIRHYIAIQFARRNWSLIKIQKFLRHKRATTTDIYLRSLINIKSSGASILD